MFNITLLYEQLHGLLGETLEPCEVDDQDPLATFKQRIMKLAKPLPEKLLRTSYLLWKSKQSEEKTVSLDVFKDNLKSYILTFNSKEGFHLLPEEFTNDLVHFSSFLRPHLAKENINDSSLRTYFGNILKTRRRAGFVPDPKVSLFSNYDGKNLEVIKGPSKKVPVFYYYFL